MYNSHPSPLESETLWSANLNFKKKRKYTYFVLKTFKNESIICKQTMPKYTVNRTMDIHKVNTPVPGIYMEVQNIARTLL